MMTGIARATVAALTARMGQLFISDLLAALLAEQAARPGDQNGDHDNKSVGVAKVRRDVSRAEGLDQAKEQSANDGARQIAKSADHADHESLEAETAAHGRFGEEDRRYQQPRDPRQHGTEGKGDGDGAVDGDADQSGRVQVLCGRLHQDSEPGPGQEEELQQEDHRERRKDEELMHRQDEAAETQRRAADRGGQRDRQRPPNDQREIFQYDPHRDRRQDHQKCRTSAQRKIDQHHEHDADQRHRHHGDGPGRRNRQLMGHRAADADEAAQHQQLALRKVDDLHGVEDQEQAECDESIDASKRQAVDDELTHEGSVPVLFDRANQFRRLALVAIDAERMGKIALGVGLIADQHALPVLGGGQRIADRRFVAADLLDDRFYHVDSVVIRHREIVGWNFIFILDALGPIQDFCIRRYLRNHAADRIAAVGLGGRQVVERGLRDKAGIADGGQFDTEIAYLLDDEGDVGGAAEQDQAVGTLVLDLEQLRAHVLV